MQTTVWHAPHPDGTIPKYTECNLWMGAEKAKAYGLDGKAIPCANDV